MRLIDADALVKRLEKSHEYHAKTSREEVLLFRDIRIINEQPTAYDLDKVVEQLKEFQGEMEQFSCDGILTDMIEIVKRGGVDADFIQYRYGSGDSGREKELYPAYMQRCK